MIVLKITLSILIGLIGAFIILWAWPSKKENEIQQELKKGRFRGLEQ